MDSLASKIHANFDLVSNLINIGSHRSFINLARQSLVMTIVKVTISAEFKSLLPRIRRFRVYVDGFMLTEHAFFSLFSLSMHTSIRHSAQTLLARSLWAKVQESRENVIHTCLIVVAVSSLWLIYYCADLCWLLWTQVHGSVVRAVDCRSAGPWFNSGWRSWFTFMTCSDNPNEAENRCSSARARLREIQLRIHSGKSLQVSE